MQTSDPHRTIARLAIGGAAVGFLIPLLPVYGIGGHLGSIFSAAFSMRGLIAFLLGQWINAAVVAVGILFLRQNRLGVAGGVFAAVGLTLALTVVQQVLVTSPYFRWQTNVVFALEMIEGVLLALAAIRAIGASSA
jgi:hypothetical protein